MTLTAPPLALYVHFPWCVRKCPYCDFNSHTLNGELPEQAYIDALRADLRQQLSFAQGRTLQSIFMGGGTPSLFAPAALAELLEFVAQQLPLAADAEITMEANPGTIEHHRFSDYRAAGINRVSLGGQSFGAAQLERLGRIHAADDTRRAAEELHRAGLTNFNIDLMYGLPGQDVAGAVDDMRSALALQPAHVSHYQLTLEPGTVFGGRPPPDLPDEELLLPMLEGAQTLLGAAGFGQYEVSAYARAGRQSRHNLNYWRFGDYLGIGAGAHGKYTDVTAGRIVRTTREREPRRYLASAASAPGSQIVDAAQLPFEFMMNALRLPEGFAMQLFEARTGLAAAAVEATLDPQRARGLIEVTGGHFRPTLWGCASSMSCCSNSCRGKNRDGIRT
ncbi:MAG: radical SAM family heme chaperone HemW [Steroidobacteraceae bacterium]